MDKEVLVEEQLRQGEQLVSALDKAGFPVEAALWLYSPDAERYHLVLETPLIKSDGRSTIYLRLKRVLDELGSPLTVEQIAVVPPSDPLLKSLSGAINTGRSLSRIRIKNSLFGNHHVRDALVYRLPARTRVTPTRKGRRPRKSDRT